ncbi:MAG: carboxypeptidase regulatory-like domain-containing protein [Polyangiaceae bacterium]|nr:carboxypeptidase regulatory-like domain-containing protein [Polyangiaceae bacterium]
MSLLPAAVAGLIPQAAWAEPHRIQVRGAAQLRVHAWTDAGEVAVQGELADDANTPIALASLTVKAFGENGSQLSVVGWTPCDARLRRGARSSESVVTDERGAFCVKASIATAASISVRYDGSDNYDGGEVRANVETARGPLAPTLLRFEPVVEVLDLDRDSVPVSGSLRIGRSDSSTPPPKREGLTVVLEDERGKVIAQTTTGGDGKARFEIPTKELADPGPGELRLRFAGSDGLAKATAVQPIIRQVEVKLSVPEPQSTSDDEVTLDVDVTASRGVVAGGVVEAVREGVSVGAATVKDGKAHVVAAIATEREGAVKITLRYVPNAPWYRPGPDLVTTVTIAGAGLWRQLLLAVLVCGVAAWVIAGWRRAKPKARREEEGGAPPPSGRPGVQVIGRAPSAGGWRGVVVDAHEGTPVPGARLSIIAPSFQGDGVVARATADEHGAFHFDPATTREARLVVEADLHSRYEQALPPPSALHVALITRRRALLDRLVKWARNQGAPFDGPAEPTPGHVRRAAVRLEMQDGVRWEPVERWAGKVEDAAYGPEAPGAAEEEAVRAAEPGAYGGIVRGA